MSNLELVSYNKKFLYCAAGAPGSTHDARMLRNSAIYQKKKVVTGHAIPDRVIDLGEQGKNLLEIAFSKLAWLMNVFREDTSDRRETYFDKKLCSRRL